MSNRRFNTNKLSAKEQVVHNMIAQLRNHIFHAQLEREFLETEILPECNDSDQHKMIQAQINQIIAVENQTIKHLTFYKRKKKELANKKLMNDYKKFPEKLVVQETEQGMTVQAFHAKHKKDKSAKPADTK